MALDLLTPPSQPQMQLLQLVFGDSERKEEKFFETVNCNLYYLNNTLKQKRGGQ